MLDCLSKNNNRADKCRDQSLAKLRLDSTYPEVRVQFIYLTSTIHTFSFLPRLVVSRPRCVCSIHISYNIGKIVEPDVCSIQIFYDVAEKLLNLMKLCGTMGGRVRPPCRRRCPTPHSRSSFSAFCSDLLYRTHAHTRAHPSHG